MGGFSFRVFQTVVLFSLAAATVQNVHIALTGDPSSMYVSWLTDDDDATYVQFGTSSGSYPYSAEGQSSSYAPDNAGYNHNVKLEGLNTSTTYFYQCGTQGSWGTEYSFTTQAADTKGFVIALYGDMGIDNSANNIARLTSRVTNKEIDWIYHAGDLSYANDHIEFEDTWNEWFASMQPIMGAVPYMVAPGNHEVACRAFEVCYSWTQNFTTYKNKFMMPWMESGSYDNMYYSFDYGLAHFITVSTETGYLYAPSGNDDGQQLEWLEKDLIMANKNREEVPWIFVVAHRPIYSAVKKDHSGEDPASSEAHIQAAFEKLFNQYHVNVYFTGHVHLYERQYPVYMNQTMGTTYTPPNSTVHITSGAGGNIEGLNKFKSDDIPDWHAFGFNQDFGYGILQVYNETTIEWQFYDDSDNLQDDVVITNWFPGF